VQLESAQMEQKQRIVAIALAPSSSCSKNQYRSGDAAYFRRACVFRLLDCREYRRRCRSIQE